MQLTGDPRRLANGAGFSGFVKVMDPWPYHYSFGTSDEEITANNLQYLEEVIQYEGPDEIAAMFIETVTGTNGILPPPRGYLKGLRALLDKYGILLVCDEVMCGWGRTGKLFGFEHGDIVPDIVTMAKGLTSSYIPLGRWGFVIRLLRTSRKCLLGWAYLQFTRLFFGNCRAVIDVMLEEKARRKRGAAWKSHAFRDGPLASQAPFGSRGALHWSFRYD